MKVYSNMLVAELRAKVKEEVVTFYEVHGFYPDYIEMTAGEIAIAKTDAKYYNKEQNKYSDLIIKKEEITSIKQGNGKFKVIKH